MNNFTTDLIGALALKQDLDEVLRVHVEFACNELLKIELAAYLNYEKYSREGWKVSNSRNGYYERIIDTKYGKLNIQVPRDRNGEFTNQTLEPYQRRSDALESAIIHMFQKGMSSRDIGHVISKMYGHHYSPTTVSNITKAVDELVDSFKKRPLKNRYTCIFLDATVIPLRRDTVQKEAVYIAIGIREDGTKEVLSYLIAPNESAYVWGEILRDIKHRGVEEVLMFTTDGLSGIKDRIHETYPRSRHQSCLVHVQRNIYPKVRKSDAQEIADDFRNTYEQENKHNALKALDAFKDKWGKKYPSVIKSLDRNESLYSFMDFPPGIRKTLYSTNLIEGFNKQLKSYTKRKDQFPTEDSLERFIVSRFDDYNDKHLQRTHQGFGKYPKEIARMFDAL